MEKLTIEERKIIQILLKHLMYQRNEIAYLKNKAALNNDDKDFTENSLAPKKHVEGLPKIIIGGKMAAGGLPETMQGEKKIDGGLAETMQGGNDAGKGLVETMQGGNDVGKGLVETMQGGCDIIKGLDEMMQGGNKTAVGLDETMQGGNKATGGLDETMQGGKTVLTDLSISNVDTNGGALLYSIFEKELLNALEDYIKNGAGRNTLYTFYSDFEDAVNEQNLAAAKIIEATANGKFEDTHSLPLQIINDDYTIARLSVALRKHLPRRVNNSLHHTITTELLFLYNAGKATSAEMRGCGKLSADGFEKHLTKLIEYGFIKKQAPSNYVLTDKSNHILLELFGVVK